MPRRLSDFRFAQGPNMDDSRRQFVKKAAYLPPAILTLAVAPSYAKAGSVKEEDKKVKEEKVKKVKLK
jgi:hypothetical protein